MKLKCRCPYCGAVAYQERTTIEKTKISGETGKILYKSGSDYTECPVCGVPFGSSYGIIYKN